MFLFSAMDIITSRNNEKIKLLTLLSASASARRERGLFVTEGLRLCRDAALSKIEIEEAYFTTGAIKRYGEEIAEISQAAKRCFEISDSVAEKISDTKSPQGIFTLNKTLDKSLFIDKIKYNGLYVALENIQTPANLGAVCRTAEALGLDGIIVGGGCDIYNPKTLRASMGAMFRLKVCEVESLPEFLSFCRQNKMATVAAVPDSRAQSIVELNIKSGVVAVIGNEGSGLTEEALSQCSNKVTIPMKGRAESLNAAAAASIIMWELVR